MKFFVRASGSPELLVELGKRLGMEPAALDQAGFVLTDSIEEVEAGGAEGKTVLVVANLRVANVIGSEAIDSVMIFSDGLLYGNSSEDQTSQ